MNRENINFVDKLFKSTLAKSMSNLKMHMEDDFEIIEEEVEEETKCAESQTMTEQIH